MTIFRPAGGAASQRRVVVPPILSLDGAQPIIGRERLVHVHGQTMGTRWSVMLYAASTACAPQARAAAQVALDHVVSEMSPWVADSALSRFNAAPAGSWHTLPKNLFAVLSAAVNVARDSGGAFDPTVGTLVNAWGFGPEQKAYRALSAKEMEGLGQRYGWTKLEIDHERRRVRQPGGIQLDLCGIAKGFGVDQVARAFRRLGIRDFLIDVGGEVRGEGVKPDGTPWWVALEEPPSIDGASSANANIIVALHGHSIATSGDYRRFFESDGRRYAHSIDPSTGAPADNGAAAVTVLHESCMHADALATAMMVLGPEKALAFAQSHEIAARVISRRENCHAEHLTSAFTALMSDD